MKTGGPARIIGEGIDHIITLPVFNWDNMRAQIPMANIYNSLKTKLGKSPLIHVAEKLEQRVKKKDVVVLTTGFYVTSGDTLETDGPPGAVTLARGIDVGLEAALVMVVDEDFVDSMKAICAATGLNVCGTDKIKNGQHRIAVEGFPKEDKKAEATAERLMRTLNPSALISVECDDRNSKGVYHSASGNNLTPYQAKLPVLFDSAYRSDAFTVGIGDFGNEIGMANLREIFQELTPSHANCKCGCGSGIVGSTRTHGSIIANISNWGAYGLEAALALVLQNSDVMHDPALETRVLEETARQGYVDGATGLIEPTADGASREINANIVHMLRALLLLQESKLFQRALS